jgi:hypothetical protein
MPISFLIEYINGLLQQVILISTAGFHGYFITILLQMPTLINGIDKAEGSVAEKNAIKGKLWFIELCTLSISANLRGALQSDGANTQLGVPI